MEVPAHGHQIPGDGRTGLQNDRKLNHSSTQAQHGGSRTAKQISSSGNSNGVADDLPANANALDADDSPANADIADSDDLGADGSRPGLADNDFDAIRYGACVNAVLCNGTHTSIDDMYKDMLFDDHGKQEVQKQERSEILKEGRRKGRKDL